MDWAGAVKVAGYLIGLGVGCYGLYRIYLAGKVFQHNRQLKREIKGHDEFHKDGEKWDAAGGLGGAADRMSDSDS